MTSDLQHFIQTTALIDTHEHLHKEDAFVNNGPDILQDLFAMYIGNDLISSGADFEAVRRVIEDGGSDLEARWDGIKDAWEVCQYTGYGQAVQLIAKLVYSMDEINVETLFAAEEINQQLRQPGQRLKLLREKANLDHVQVDDFTWVCQPDESGLDFFLYDLSWQSFCSGTIDFEHLLVETNIEVSNLKSLKTAMTSLFDKYAAYAIAVKSQHAYYRTLKWIERESLDVEKVLQKILREESISEDERLCLGDWCWSQGVELSIEYNLPFKIHTGYLAGHEFYHNPDGTRAANFAPLINKYSKARFVLMHINYPFTGEILALAKHFPSVHVDMCWAWSINPYDGVEFVRRAIHSVPINKLFAFGGDTFWPTSVVAYAAQARQGLYQALQTEIIEGYLSEQNAIHIAQCLMQDNQRKCFDIEGTRQAIKAAL